MKRFCTLTFLFSLMASLAFGQQLRVDSPAEVAGFYPILIAGYGPDITFDISGDIVIADDGNDPASDACETITNDFYLRNYGSELNTQTPNPYSYKEFEASPLSRPMKQAAPGNSWQIGSGHEIKMAYKSNVANEVKRFEVNFVGNDTEQPQLVTASTDYPAGSLYKQVVKDENWDDQQTNLKDHTTEEFTDKLGRVVLKRTFDSSAAVSGDPDGKHDTYYVYDDYGNLTYVIPPKVNVSDGVSSTELTELCYQYVYDKRDRLVEKQLPGKGREYIVYNKLNQPVMTKDAQNSWIFTKYDAFGRVAYNGFASGGTRSSVQTDVDGFSGVLWVSQQGSYVTIDGHNVYYDTEGYPANASITELHMVNYYDDYLTARDGVAKPAGPIFGQEVAQDVTNLPTCSKVRVLDTQDWISTLTVYDEKARAIYSHTSNDYLNTTDIIKSELDFTGKVVKTESSHQKGSAAAIVSTDNFSYDPLGRLLKQEQTIGSHTELIAKNSYDVLGQLARKDVGNTESQPLQTVDFEYNIRGWLKSINDVSSLGSDLFGFKIEYDSGGNALYNGNIAKTEWKTANDNVLRSYMYDYDPLNRITAATSSSANYHLSSVAYDKNGNIESLSRKGHTNSGATTFGNMDVLDYGYHNSEISNRLYKVRDDGNDTYGFKDSSGDTQDYWYDSNGNLTSDLNKGIAADGIEYNHLNMPTKITVSSGSETGILEYEYAADGNKLQKVRKDLSGTILTTTDYSSDYVYENGNLTQITQPEGYIEPNGSGWQYVYRYTDIWGNTRITYSDDNNNGIIDPVTEIRREQNYYPLGLEHQGYNYVSYGVKNNLQTYQGQEFTEDLELNVHEWRYRMSDPAIGRFWQIDPLAEDYMYNSTYAFQENKLGMGIELEGLENLNWDELSEDGIIAGAGTGIDTGDGSAIQASEPGVVSRAGSNLSSALGSVGDALGAIHEVAVNAVSGTISSFTGTIEANSVLSDSEFNTAITSGDENAVLAGLENEAAAAYNAAPDIIAEAIITSVEIAVAESAASSKSTKSSSSPKEAYNRRRHYGNTPTAADRKYFNASSVQDVNHKTPLVKHYYEQGGHAMTAAQRKQFARDRRNMEAISIRQNRAEGGRLATYSRAIKKKYGL